jgi:hypothetical protein
VTTTLDERTEAIRFAGNIGFWALVLLIPLLAIHPPGTTELYDDGSHFLEHVDGLWVAIHFLAGLASLAVLPAIREWGRNLAGPRAETLGEWALYVAIVGAAVGMIHLLGTDTTAFVAFADTFEAGGGSEAVGVGADLLLRLHAATLVTWVVSSFLALPAVLGWAAYSDGRFPGWYPWLVWVAALLAAASVIVTLAESQFTTLSEMGLFRPAATLYLVWLLITTWWMRRGSLVRAP